MLKSPVIRNSLGVVTAQHTKKTVKFVKKNRKWFGIVGFELGRNRVHVDMWIVDMDPTEQH